MEKAFNVSLILNFSSTKGCNNNDDDDINSSDDRRSMVSIFGTRPTSSGKFNSVINWYSCYRHRNDNRESRPQQNLNSTLRRTKCH